MLPRGEFIRPRHIRITLLQAIPKGRIMESIIEKATELGAHRIVPLLTERVGHQLMRQRRPSKREPSGNMWPLKP